MKAWAAGVHPQDPEKTFQAPADTSRLGFADRDTLPPKGGYAVGALPIRKAPLGARGPPILMSDISTRLKVCAAIAPRRAPEPPEPVCIATWWTPLGLALRVMFYRNCGSLRHALWHMDGMTARHQPALRIRIGRHEMDSSIQICSRTCGCATGQNLQSS